jgi:outer membrane protein insertion porin family
MISISGLKIGDKIKIPGDAITGAIRKIWKYGLVGDITIEVQRIEGENIYLNIVLAERSRLTAFYFTGITKGQESGLKEDLDLIRGKIVNDAMVRNTEMAVKKYFVKKGFLSTEVKVVQEKDTLNSDGIKLRIAINPKSKIKIHRINFEGNSNVDDATLKRRLKKTKEHPRFTLHRTIIQEILHPAKYFGPSYPVDWRGTKEFFNDHIKLNIFSSSKLIQADYEEDKKKLLEYYNSKGYRDAEIISDTIYSHNDKTINIDFKIHEGPKYYFRNIIWTGNYIYNDKQLGAVLAISKGDVYNRDQIEKKLHFNPKGPDISGLYMDDGYLFFRINPVEVAVDGDSIDVEMRIFEGEQATINQVLITGNNRTSDHVIRRELSTVPGRKFRRSDIIRTQQSLSQLGYFAPDKVSQNMMPNPDEGTVDIEWQVEEQSNDQVELSGGWGGFYGFVGTLGLTFNNFSVRNIPHFKNWSPLPVGDGQRLSVRVQANGRQYQSYSFSFTEPWLGGRKPHSFSVSLNSSVQRQYFYSASVDPTGAGGAPKLRINSVTVGLGRRLEWPDNYFTLTNSVSYQQYQLENYGFGGLGFSDGNANSFTFNTTLARRSTNEIMYPSQGSEITMSLTLTPPYSLWRNINYADVTPEGRAESYKWFEYHKWMFDARYYLPLDNKKKLVLEARAHFGFLGQYSTKAGVGPFERFYLGGDGLAGGFGSFLLGQEIIGLRGYGNHKVTPPDYDGPDTNPSDVTGGIVYNKFSLELRYPVTTGNAATIYGLLFTEAGNNWNNYEDFSPFNLYKSAGFGARIFMPAFGLIGLNWGYGFDTLPGATERSGGQFHFTIGQQIR